MKVLILIDAKNFEQGFYSLCSERKQFRFIDFYKISTFLMNYLKNNVQYKEHGLQHVRTYFYTGEFTDKLIEKIEYFTKNISDKEIASLLSKAKKDKKKQANFFKIAKNYYFFEVRTKPLQFSTYDKKIIQKGVDVQLAVDLVDFTHKNIFDIAVILSGDIDLLESVKTAKGMGKQIIIFGENNSISEEMKKYADYFIDIERFTDEQLNQFSHVSQYKKEE